eukprot:TRINITY_DN76319_c0_g1_i1.p1 TRINITY_DN76319_c0_g1~~TRINITY_DN76319_c0_g1_i1.p1  ORF type:complete len:218 (-),score=36.28 TRINITY_DN76319_c0_g1_i1:31-684(-)
MRPTSSMSMRSRRDEVWEMKRQRWLSKQKGGAGGHAGRQPSMSLDLRAVAAAPQRNSPPSPLSKLVAEGYPSTAQGKATMQQPYGDRPPSGSLGHGGAAPSRTPQRAYSQPMLGQPAQRQSHGQQFQQQQQPAYADHHLAGGGNFRGHAGAQAGAIGGPQRGQTGSLQAGFNPQAASAGGARGGGFQASCGAGAGPAYHGRGAYGRPPGGGSSLVLG